jgi:hypothetical protein
MQSLRILRKLEKTQLELHTAEMSFDARTRNLQKDLIETKLELQARLEAVETRTERGNTPAVGASGTPPPTFNGGGVTATLPGRTLRVLMTSSSMRLAELLLSLLGTHRGPGMRCYTDLGQLLVVPLGNDTPEVWICMTSRGWRLSSHKGQWRVYDRSLPRGGIMTPGYYCGLPGTNAGEHSYGGNFG